MAHTMDRYPPKVLTDDAIPTIFGKSRDSSDTQRKKRAKKQLIDKLLQSMAHEHVPGNQPTPSRTTTSLTPGNPQPSTSYPTPGPSCTLATLDPTPSCTPTTRQTRPATRYTGPSSTPATPHAGPSHIPATQYTGLSYTPATSHTH
ncbi:hypothetical protein Bbelb_314000 [Branchiostoma belcheri]|nr:hypothetical protein Bbelb_314000 [Branchiostoma belcheri]